MHCKPRYITASNNLCITDRVISTHIHEPAHTHTYTYTHAHMRSHERTLTCTHTDTRTYSYACAYTCAHTQKHSQILGMAQAIVKLSSMLYIHIPRPDVCVEPNRHPTPNKSKTNPSCRIRAPAKSSSHCWGNTSLPQLYF